MRRFKILVLASLACVAALTVVSNASAGNFDKFRMGCTGEEPAVCAVGTVGQQYSLTIYLDRDSNSDPDRGADFDCATYRVSSGAFPPGLSISDEGLVSGTPTQAGHYDFYLTVEYRKTSFCPGKTPSDDRFVIDVNPGAPKLTITTASLPDANVNQAYTSPLLAASGAPVNSWSLASGTLPAGLALAPNGVISGTPTQSGLFGFTVQANATGASDTHQLTLFVLAPLTIQTLLDKTPPETGLTAKRLVNQPLPTGVKAVGGRAPYTFSAEGDLPPGITLDPATGKITGAGTKAGQYAFTVTVTDATGAKASVPWNITILPLLDFTTGKGLPIGHVNKRYSARIPVKGKDSATAVFAIAGRIPPGLKLDGTGRLVGRPLKTGTYKIRVSAVSETGARISKQFTIRVRA
jgi:putative Ig domain-containing protein